MKFYALSLLMLTAALAFGCISPEARFNDFVDGKGRNGAGGASGSSGETPAQFPVAPEQITGTYLYVVSTIIAPKIPTVYLAELQAENVDDAILLRIRQRPLSKVDRFTPVGEWGAWREVLLDTEGAIESEPLRTIVPAEANAVTGFETVTEISMHGRLFNLAGDDLAGPVEFFCGAITGSVLSPIAVPDLTGSTFTGSRIPDVHDRASYPPVVINCERDLARPLP